MQAAGAVLHVGAHVSLGRGPVLLLHRPEDVRVVVVHGPGGRVVALVALVGPGPQQRLQAPQQVRDRHVLARLGQPEVELHVVVDLGADRLGAQHRPQQGPQLGHVAFAAPYGREAGRGHLEGTADLDEVQHAVATDEQAPLDDLGQDRRVRLPDVGAVTQPHLDDAEQPEQLDRLPDGRSPDAQGLGQLTLRRQSLAAGEAPGRRLFHQVPGQLGGDVLRRLERDRGHLQPRRHHDRPGAVIWCTAVTPSAPLWRCRQLCGAGTR